MKKTIFAFLCCALLASGLLAAEKPGGAWDTRLRSYTGSVLVRPAGTKRWVNARAGLPLKRGDLVRTGKKSSADLSLDGKGIISLSASTEFALKEQKRTASDFVLSAGRLIAKVTGLKKLSARLTVRTPTSVCAVRGTEFGVAYDKDLDETLVNVFEEGEVEVTSLDETGNPVGETLTVIPRNEVRVKKEMEAMTLAPSPAQRYRDPGISSVRKKLTELDKSYKPMENREREELRGEVLSGERYAKGSASGDAYARGNGQGGAAEKGAGQKGGAEAGGGGQAAERGADGKLKASDGPGRAAKAGARATGDGSEKAGADGVRKARQRDDDGEGHSRMAGGHNRKQGAGRGGGDDAHSKSLAGGRGGKAGSGAAAAGSGDGPRIKSASGAGGAGSMADRDREAPISRPVSPTDKNVDAAVSRLQERLSYTGNDGAIPSSELRTMVVSAAKTTATDAAFTSALNASLVERLALTETTSLSTAKTALGATQTSVSTTKSGVGVTSPNITSPVMTNTGISGSNITNTKIGTTVKKKP